MMLMSLTLTSGRWEAYEGCKTKPCLPQQLLLVGSPCYFSNSLSEVAHRCMLDATSIDTSILYMLCVTSLSSNRLLQVKFVLKVDFHR